MLDTLLMFQLDSLDKVLALFLPLQLQLLIMATGGTVVLLLPQLRELLFWQVAGLQQAHQQWLAFLNGELKHFDLPLHYLWGTPFQQSVWTALQNIAYGQTTSYADIAHAVARPSAFRAVGAAVEAAAGDFVHVGPAVQHHRLAAAAAAKLIDGQHEIRTGGTGVYLNARLTAVPGVLQRRVRTDDAERGRGVFT